MMKTLVIYVFIGMFVVSAKGQNIRIRLDNCTLEPETLTRIQNSLNFQLDFYARIFNYPVDSAFKARVFGSEKEFLKYSKAAAYYNPRRTHAIAFYSSRLKEMVLHKDIDDFATVFSHELSHAILHFYCPDASTWLDEGLAEFLEDIVLIDSSNYFASPHVIKLVNVHDELTSDASIQNVIYSNNFYQVNSSRNYTLSFAIILYLYNAKLDLLRNIILGECDERSNELDTFDFQYPGGIDVLEIDVRSWFLNYRP